MGEPSPVRDERTLPAFPPPAWHADWAAWTLLLVGLIFLFGGPFQLFPLPGWVDAGIYQGYALNLPALVSRYGFRENSYHGSRLPYVLVLYLSHRVAAAEVAQYLQLLFFYLMTVLSLLALGYRRFGRAPALLGTAFLAFNPLFFSALTFGGADSAAVAYVALSLAFLFSPSGLGGRTPSLLAGGAAGACATAAHPFAVPALAGVVAAYFVAARAGGPALGRCVKLAAGGLLALVGLGLIGTAFGLDFFFLKYSFGMGRRMAGGFGANYALPPEWPFGFYRLLVPAVLGGGALALALARPQLRRDRLFLAALLAQLLPLLLYLCSRPLLGFPVLAGRHYVTPLLPGLTLGVFALAKETAVGWAIRWALPGALLLGLPAAVVGAGFLSPAQWSPEADRLLFGSLAGLATVLALLLFRAHRSARAKASSWSFTASLTLCAVCFALNKDSLQAYRVTTGDDYKEVFLGASHLVDVLEKSKAGESLPLFWFDREAANAHYGLTSTYNLDFKGKRMHLNLFDTMASYYLWDRSHLADSTTGVNHARLDKVGARPIVCLASEPRLCERALRRVRRRGFDVAVRYWVAHPARRFGWVAVVFDIKRRS